MFLRDKWQEKKKENPLFSIRSWSRFLGFANNTPLSLMLAGKRAVPKKYIPALAKSLALSSKEISYLEALITYEAQKDISAKEFYINKLKELSPRGEITSVEVETFKYFGNPICMTILEMSELPDFSPCLKWIMNRLNFKTTQSEIKECLQVLENLDLIVFDIDGRLQKTHKHITNKTDVADKGSQSYHKNVSLLASEAVMTQLIHEREFNGYALNIQKSQIPHAKKLIRDFIKSFISEIEAGSKEGDETYQFNVQLFQLTSKQKEKQ